MSYCLLLGPTVLMSYCLLPDAVLPEATINTVALLQLKQCNKDLERMLWLRSAACDPNFAKARQMNIKAGSFPMNSATCPPHCTGRVALILEDNERRGGTRAGLLQKVVQEEEDGLPPPCRRMEVFEMLSSFTRYKASFQK